MLLIRYGVTALLNTGISIIIFYFCLWLGVAYWLAGAISLLLGITNNFFTYRYFVFSRKSSGYFWRYGIIQLIIYFGNIGAEAILSNIGIPSGWCYLLLLGPSMLSGYVFSRLFAFPQN